MRTAAVICDVCKRQKQEVNHWLVAIVRPLYEGIIFEPADAVEEPRRDNVIYEDICGQECAHKRLSTWLDELNEAFQPAEESVTA
jgi:hypothetical protein